jgi:hypothetical protein
MRVEFSNVVFQRVDSVNGLYFIFPALRRDNKDHLTFSADLFWGHKVKVTVTINKIFDNRIISAQ